jgi:pimeloyl-ACP methyl ester carboxylesterase
MTIVLIPGAGGDSYYWHLLTPLLVARGWDVVAVGLPAADESAGIEHYADAVLQAVGERTSLVLVAQSMGAFTAIAVAERVAVDLIVFVNATIPRDGETAGEWWDAVGQPAAQRALDQTEGRDPDAPFDVMTTFMHDVPPDVIDDLFSRGEPPQSSTPFATPNTWTAWHSVEHRAVIARGDRLFPLELMRRVVRDRLGLAADEIEGGHLSALSRPEELATLLDGYARGFAGR